MPISPNDNSALREWLEHLGLASFAPVFEREQIDMSNMHTLDDADLRELGIPMGPRKTLKAAIAELKITSATSTTATPGVAKPELPSAEAERRQLTVLFCDLVGSTELSQRLDPEAYRELVRSYQSVCAQVIARYEGHVAQYLGDGLLVYFGFPLAHEDDALRAVLAGIELADAVSALSIAGEPLSVRVGIHTGLVVLGEVGTGAAREHLALGDTPNVAARLQGLASPGTVVVSEHTRALVGAYATFVDLGSTTLKGVLKPVRAWRAESVTLISSRFEASHMGPIAPIIGRDAELSTLKTAWDHAKSLDGQSVLLSGEAGIGKSRLLRAMRDWVTEDGGHCIQYQCSAHFANTPLHPIIAELNGRLMGDRIDSPQARLDSLDTILEHLARPERDRNIIASLLSLPAPTRYGALNLSPAKSRAETLRALSDFLIASANTAPTVIIFEDLHWSDPTTLEFVHLLMERLTHSRILLIGSHRPDFQSPWKNSPRVTPISLGRLNRAQVDAVITHVAGGKRLPEEIVRKIVERTDGVPLFVEELTKTILESNSLVVTDDEYRLSGPLSSVFIPNSLRDSLMARLDRLGDIKEIAQVGACIGREFKRDALSLVASQSGSALDDALETLVRSELVMRHDSGTGEAYVFKHALIQDTAYDSLLKSRRTDIHRRVATALEDHFPQSVALEPEVLAHHFTEAAMAQRAIPYWMRAGRIATARSSNAEAIVHLQKGLEILLMQPASITRDRMELDFRVSFSTPMIALHGWGSAQFADACSLATGLCDRVDDSALVARALYMQWGYGTWTGRHRLAEQAAARMLSMAQAQNHRVGELMGSGLLGRVQCYLGNLREGRRNIERSLALFKAQEDLTLAHDYGQDPIMASEAGLGWCLWLLGFPRQAEQARQRALARAEAVKHPPTLAYALAVSVGIQDLLEGDPTKLEPRLARLEALIEEQGFNQWRGYSNTARAFLLSCQGVRRSAREVALKGWVSAQEVGCVILGPLFATVRAKIFLAEGAIEDALHEVEEGLALSRETEEGFVDAELLRLRGAVAIAQDNEDIGTHYLERALDTARAQGAKMLEFRAAIDRAVRFVHQGRRAEARQLLEPLVGSFSERTESLDMGRACMLLKQLS